MSDNGAMAKACTANVVASVAITMVNRQLMSEGVISSRFLTMAQAVTTLLWTTVVERKRASMQPPRGLAAARMALYVAVVYVGVTLWNVGLGKSTVSS